MVRASKIGLPYQRITHYFYWCIVCENRTGGQHGNAIRRPEHYVHVVLDQHKCVATFQTLGKKRYKTLGFVWTHAGCWFVQ